MTGVTVSPTLSEYAENLRAWQAAVATWLGLDPARVFALRDDRAGDILDISWGTHSPDRPIRGHWRGWVPVATGSDSGDPTIFRGEVALDGPDQAELARTVGEKPQLLTREQELMLRGLAAEEESRRA